jgi:signal transduction histidine kinase
LSLEVVASRRNLILAAIGAAIGLAAEHAASGWDDPRHWVPDLLVGWVLVAGGLVGWSRRPGSRTGLLVAAAGYAWFLGNFGSVGVAAIGWLSAHLLYLHRGLVVHCVLSFPSGRIRSGLDRAAVLAGYAGSLVLPVARDEAATAVLGVGLVAVAAWDFLTAVGPVRRARAIASRAAAVVGTALSGGAIARLLFPAGQANEAALLAYQAALVAAAVGLVVGLVRAGWARAAVTDLVVELAERPSASLRDALARALGDPSLRVGYWVPERGRYVDATGRLVDLPGPGSSGAVTYAELDGRAVAALVHDPAVRTDPGLLESISAAAALAASHARLRAVVREQVGAVQASRRRLVEAADAERRRLEGRLREGAGRRLDRLAGILAAARSTAMSVPDAQTRAAVERALRQLRLTMGDLHELARGLHPPALAQQGLAAAIGELVEHAGIPVDVAVSAAAAAPELQATAYFVCAEALSNIAKHAEASRARIGIRAWDGRLVVEVADDGRGGADPARGSGLRGLADRVEAVGGVFRMVSSVGGGTRLTAEVPLGGEPR